MDIVMNFQSFRLMNVELNTVNQEKMKMIKQV